jgi:signal transduction histidine kinase/DNA-binding response OmpR family regulator/CHASE3 domain sensor protein
MKGRPLFSYCPYTRKMLSATDHKIEIEIEILMSDVKASNTVARQLQFVFGFSILILMVSSYASYYSNSQLIDSSELVNHTNEVIINAESVISTLKDAESGQRGYIISNDPQFLEPYKGVKDRVGALVDEVAKLTSDNPVQQKYIDALRPLIDQRLTQMQKVLEMGDTLVLEERANLYLVNTKEIRRGKLIMDELRKVVEAIKKEEKRLLKERTEKQEMYSKYTPIFVLVAALLSILLSVLAYLRIKADLDQRIRKQEEERKIYEETSRRIGLIEGVTREIAQGNYAIRSLDEAKDELGRISEALNIMAVSLETNFTEMQRRDWLQSGSVAISDAIRGEKFLQSVCLKIINSVAGYLQAPVATLYTIDGGQNLKLRGSYGADNAPAYIRAGQGLTGQVISGKELLVVTDLPAQYLNISSSLGNTSPICVVIVPLIFGTDPIAVMEIAMLHTPTAAELEFIRNNAETLGIGINTASSYEHLQELLEETQAQSEELQAQHNELENINAELEVQTEKLQASEEELKVQQEELQESNAELEERSRLLEERNQLIVEKNAEVQRKAEELALSTKYKSEFLANMSHELRTPLNSILLLSRLLKENNEKTLTPDQVEYAHVIQSSGNGLLLLIDEILDLSKIEAGKMELEYERVALVDIVEDINGLFAPVAKEKGLAFSVTIDKKTDPVIETDKMRLSQVLKNLISNALKFTQEGNVTMAISANEGKSGYIDLSVTDTGIGISKDKQAAIFEAFQQEDGSTRRKFGGTGLGLSISKELAKLLGGDITLDSEQGKGSTFTITIPVSKQLKEEAEKEEVISYEILPEVEPVKETPPVDQFISTQIPESIPDDRGVIVSSDKAILIIEDDVHFAKSLLDYTRKKGYKGIVAVRGDEGIELARQYRPLGILLDLQLPVKSGWQVMEELKADAFTRHIPVHMMSSHSVKRESLMKGAINFIDKPVAFEQMQEIFTKLEHVLSQESKKVLIVEENPKHAKALAYFLETFNITAEIKNTIASSVDALQNEADCVILDMGIPAPRSYETLEQVKKTKGLEHLPIIIFTGKSLSMTEEHKIKQYADSIIVKTAHSYQRVIDEVSLFLHIVEENKKKANGGSNKKLGGMNEVLSKKTVLIVDDDVRNIFSLSKALEQQNMNVLTAIDGKEALQKLNDNMHVDVVLLDMMMPEMDGYETARNIRSRKQWKNLPVIAVTAKAMSGDREKCIQAGASDYITKPVDIDQLLSLLRVWLYEKN